MTDMGTALHDLEEVIIRDSILKGVRADGRSSKDLRPIECKVNLLPRVHGSAVFQRGETQAFVTVALGTGRDEQRVDGLIDEYSKKFMLDYNFPSFSVGECRPIRGPGDRRGRGFERHRSWYRGLREHRNVIRFACTSGRQSGRQARLRRNGRRR